MRRRLKPARFAAPARRPRAGDRREGVLMEDELRIPSARSLAVVVAGAQTYSSPLVARVSTRATPSAPLVRRKASSSRPVAVKAR